jgi:hypothetical protein
MNRTSVVEKEKSVKCSGVCESVVQTWCGVGTSKDEPATSECEKQATPSRNV